MSEQGSRVILRGHCPNCGADRNAEVVAEDTVEGEDKSSGVWGKSTYSLLRCLGCDWRYIRHLQACSEDTELEDDPETGEQFWEIKERVTYWPSSSRAKRARPGWLWLAFEFTYAELAALLEELYTALDNDLHRLATVGMRTVFDCASQLLGTNPNQSFGEKLKELAAGNKIGGEEKEILSILADAGSAAAHRGWKPTAAEIDTLMHALENFLHRAFVLKHEFRRMKKNIPSRLGS